MKEKVAQGRTVFFSTHMLEQAEKLCRRVGILYKGRLAAVGTLEELRAKGGSLEEIFFAVTGGASTSASLEFPTCGLRSGGGASPTAAERLPFPVSLWGICSSSTT